MASDPATASGDYGGSGTRPCGNSVHNATLDQTRLMDHSLHPEGDSPAAAERPYSALPPTSSRTPAQNPG